MSNYMIDDVARSFVNQAKYNAKQDTFQQGAIAEYLAEDLKGIKPIDGYEITSGQIITLARKVEGSFTPNEKAEKNNAMSQLRMMIRRSFSATGEDGNATYPASEKLSLGLKMATTKKADRLVFKAKEPTEEKSVKDILRDLVEQAGMETVETALAEIKAEEYSKEIAS